MQLNFIDSGKEFDFGKTSQDYAKYRDIYPKSMYDKLISFGIGKENQKILDLGSGTAVLPVNLYRTGANFTSTDISENQIAYGRKQIQYRYDSFIRRNAEFYKGTVARKSEKLSWSGSKSFTAKAERV